MYEKSVERLNQAVGDELSAVHQYMYFHFHCDDQGLETLSRLFLQTAMDEMRHIETIAERILFLKGEVEMKASAEVQKLHDPSKMLQLGKEMEQGSIRDYNLWANECSQGADANSRKLFEALVDDEERHYGQWDNELENIEKYGPSYLALQAMERSRGGNAPA